MLSYFISASNVFTIRTEPTGSNSFTMSLQDMTALTNQTASLSGLTYNGYESILGFTASISGAYTGQEFRATIINGSEDIWHGSVQVYASQSVDSSGKSVYKTQIPLDDAFISNVSENKYIILD